jgi:hypothetical protein
MKPTNKPTKPVAAKPKGDPISPAYLLIGKLTRGIRLHG